MISIIIPAFNEAATIRDLHRRLSACEATWNEDYDSSWSMTAAPTPHWPSPRRSLTTTAPQDRFAFTKLRPSTGGDGGPWNMLAATSSRSSMRICRILPKNCIAFCKNAEMVTTLFLAIAPTQGRDRQTRLVTRSIIAFWRAGEYRDSARLRRFLRHESPGRRGYRARPNAAGLSVACAPGSAFGKLAWNMSTRCPDRGTSKYTFAKLLELGLDGIINFSSKPLRLIMVAGVLLGLFSLAVALVVLVQYIGDITIGNDNLRDTKGWTSLILAVLFLSMPYFFAWESSANTSAGCLTRSNAGRCTWWVRPSMWNQ